MLNYTRPTPAPPTSRDSRLILALRLLVARAAQSDSLRWWDDEALTAPAAFVLQRAFPFAPALAARSLALTAAQARHAAAAAHVPAALHLFHLDPQRGDELALRHLSPLAAPLDAAPVADLADFARRLSDLAGPRPAYETLGPTDNGGLFIRPGPTPRGVHIWRHRAATLAWAFAAGQPGRPVIPLIWEAAPRR